MSNAYKDIGLALLKLATAHERLVEAAMTYDHLTEDLGPAINTLGSVIEDIDACRQANEPKAQPLSGNSAKPYLDS